MKVWIFLAVVLLPSTLFAQETTPLPTMEVFKRFEYSRKDKAEAFAWSFFLPGGGSIYAGEVETGGLLFVGEALNVVWIRIVAGNNGATTFPVMTFVLLRAVDFALAFDAVDRYNHGLLEKLSVSVGASRIGIQFNL